MTHFEAYMLTRLDSLIELGIGALLVGILLFAFLITAYLFPEDLHGLTVESKAEKKVNLKKGSKYALPLMLCGTIILTFIPTTKEMAFIYIAPAITNNQHLQETLTKLPNISKLGLEYLEETLKDNINNE